MERELPQLVPPELNAGEMVVAYSDEAFINGAAMYDGFSYQSLLNLPDLSLHLPPSADSSLDFQMLKFPKVEPVLLNSDDDLQYYYYDHDGLTTYQQSILSLNHHHHNHRYGGEMKPYASPSLQLQQTPATFDFLHMPKLEPVTDDLNPNNNNNEIMFLTEPLINYAVRHLPENRQPAVAPRVSRVMKRRMRKPYESSMTRIRRQKLSEKTRSLEKLLPWDKKMDTATMLEEAYKYVKFLQAQVSVLQSMPVFVEGASSEDKKGKSINNEVTSSTSVFGALGRLNRQQLLQVVLNSPKAQTYLYSKGCCIYSAEQLLQLKKIAQRNALNQQMLYLSGMLS